MQTPANFASTKNTANTKGTGFSPYIGSAMLDGL